MESAEREREEAKERFWRITKALQKGSSKARVRNGRILFEKFLKFR